MGGDGSRPGVLGQTTSAADQSPTVVGDDSEWGRCPSAHRCFLCPSASLPRREFGGLLTTNDLGHVTKGQGVPFHRTLRCSSNINESSNTEKTDATHTPNAQPHAQEHEQRPAEADSTVADKWLRLFKARNPSLSGRSPQMCESQRADAPLTWFSLLNHQLRPALSFAGMNPSQCVRPT